MRKVIKRAKPSPKKTTSLPFTGDLTAPVMIILDPVVGNLNAKSPLDKKQLQWFVDHLKKNGGFSKEDICIVSASAPCSGETWGLGSLLTAHLKEWKEELESLIKRNRPKFILPFGAKACQQVFGRAVQITKVRGQPVQEPSICHGIPILPMLSPFYAQRQPENEAAFAADLQTAQRIKRANYDLDQSTIDYKHDYQWCWSAQKLQRILKDKKLLSVDVESVGLRGYEPTTKLLTIQICYAEGKSIIVPIDYDRGKLRHHNFIPWDIIDRDRIISIIKKKFEDPRVKIFGQSFKFDWLMLHYMLGIQVANYADDTMLLGHLLDENSRGLNIDDLVRRYVPEMAGFNDPYNNDPDHHGKTRMDLLPPEKMLPYACGDTDAAWRLLPVLKKEVWADEGTRASLRDTYTKVTLPAQRAFCHIELNGFPVSQKELYAFQNKLKRIQKRERIHLLRQIPKSIKDKHKDTGVGLKVTRGVILRDWLYTHKDGLKLKPVLYTKTKEPSVSSKQALPYYVADHPVIARLIDYIKNDKLLNTYVKGFHKYIYDGLIRPSYGLTGTVTGRSMSRDPNGQNFPKRGKLAKEYRRVFKAPPGWVFVACDLSQAELRIAAMMSGDPNMLAVYAEGGDIHRTTAAGTMGISVQDFLNLPADIQGLKRFQAKAINFGFLYGMWWVKFRSYAKTEYGIDFTEEEAKEIRENFFKTYPMLEDWHRDVQNYVAGKGYIRAYDGRLRHLPNVFSEDEGVAKQAMRQAINSPVQSIASDLGLMTLGRLVPHIRKRGYDWIKPCGFIHDAIVCLVREDKVARGCALVKHFMENNPLDRWFDWTPEIPITADAEIGRTLADTVELKPHMFEGKENAHKTFDDLVAEATEKDDDKSSTIQTKRRKIKLKRSKPHAKTKTTQVHSRSSKRVQPPRPQSKRRIKRRKPPEDRAA